VAEEAEANGVLQITNVSTAADLTWDREAKRARPFVFRMCATDDVMGELLAGFARDELGAKRAAVLYEVGRTYSQRLARSFIGRFSDDVAGHVVAEFFYLALETDFRPQLNRIRDFRPDVLFLPEIANPRSTSDYVEIARDFHTVFVSAVPVLDDGSNDPARRFIALVDEFYDRNVKLVLSAAAPPDTLYRGERLAFEFQRTRSRLVEMQTHEYLARPHLG